MATLDGRAAWILLTVLLLTAVVGFEQGLVKGLAAAHEAVATSTPADTDREPVPRAQPLSSAPLDEAAVRQIAREEADAALVRSRPKKVDKPKEEQADAAGADSGADATAAPAPSTPPPAAGPPPG